MIKKKKRSKMKFTWQDLPEKKNVFTIRGAALIDLKTGKTIRSYLANTKLVVVQKCITPAKTYYRTASAALSSLDWAFEASAFGLPNEKAPLAPFPESNPLGLTTDSHKSVSRTSPAKKQTAKKKVEKNIYVELPKSGEGEQRKHWFSKFFRRHNG